MPVPLLAPVLVWTARYVLPWLLRFFGSAFVFKWAKSVAVLTAKIALFAVLWIVIKKWVFWAFGLVFSLAKGWFPLPTDPFVASILGVMKITAVWFPWEYLGLCALTIITFQLNLIIVKMIVKILVITGKTVDWAGGNAG